MKKLIIVLSVFLAVSTIASAQTTTKPSKEEAQKATYTCPMHPKVTGKQGDKCYVSPSALWMPNERRLTDRL